MKTIEQGDKAILDADLSKMPSKERRATVIKWLKEQAGEELYFSLVQGGARAVAKHRADGTGPKSVGGYIFGLQVTNHLMGIQDYAGKVLALEQWRASHMLRPEGARLN